MMLAAYTLARRELVRFVRQRNRVIGALAQPVIFWVLFGAGLHGTFNTAMAGGVSYREYFVPGVVAMILLFTAIFSTISIIEDRREGFLQSVLVAPIPRAAMVLGKVLGGTILAALQGALFLVLARFTVDGLTIAPLAAVYLLGAMALVAFGLTALGFVIAWRSESTQGFHAIMSVFLFPMWLLSGAFFPAAGAPAWLYWTIQFNPLTYGVALLRHALYLEPAMAHGAGVPAPALALGVSAAFAAVMFAAAMASAGKRVQGDLQ